MTTQSAPSVQGRLNALVGRLMALAPMRYLLIRAWRLVWRLRSGSKASWVALILDGKGHILLVRTPAGLQLPRQNVVATEPVLCAVENYVDERLPHAKDARARLLAVQGRGADHFHFIYGVAIDRQADAAASRELTWIACDRALEDLDADDRRCLLLATTSA